MSYKDLVQQFTQDGYMKKLAGSIKNKMSEQRQGANPNDSRRWIWELIQNGKDVRFKDTSFKIEVELKENESPIVLEFKHNGKPFSVKNITYLVEQVSSKDQEFEEDGLPTNTGKFGSGFLTTHLLSEKVRVETVIKADGLNYKKCQVELDRSSRQEAGITESIKTSLSILENLDDQQDLEHFEQNEFNTTFVYELDKPGIEVARTGLKDLDLAIPFVLSFVEGISNVNVIDVGEYKVVKKNIGWKENVYYYTVEKSDCLGAEPLEILLIKGKKVDIALPVKRENGQIIFTQIDRQMPRLFCDFPIIGTEEFPFPTIINSPFFNLNDPRSIVRLTDVDEPEINENKELIQEAVSLCLQVIEFIEVDGSQHVFNLTNNISHVNIEWISAEWYQVNVFEPIHKALSRCKIVDTNTGGRRAILNEKLESFVYFPFSGKPEIREEIFELALKWFPNALPRKTEIHDWANSLFPKCTKLTVKLLSQYVTGSGTVEKLQSFLQKEAEVGKWLNEYYLLLNNEEQFIKEVVANEIRVLPDQNGEFKLMKDLVFDPGIHDIFKDTLLELGVDLRAELRMSGINTAANIKDDAKYKIVHGTKKFEDVYSSINQLIAKADPTIAFELARGLAQVIGEENHTPEIRDKLFSAVQRLYGEKKLPKIYVQKYDPKIHEQVDLIILDNMVNSISKSATLNQFSLDHTFIDQNEATVWLTDFVELILQMKQDQFLQISESPILPNENGDFRIKEALYFGNTDDILKEVCSKLGYDFRDDLIDSKMSVEFDPSREITNKEIAEKIATLIGGLMTDMQQDQEIKDAFQMLYNWFSTNSKLGESLFGELYHNRHRLCAPEDIVNSLEKAAAWDSIMKEHGIETLDQLRELLSRNVNSNSGSQLTEVTQDIILSLGVSNYEEFKAALIDKNVAELFGHESVPSPEYFLFAQAKIERTRVRIKEFLESQGYDFERAELIATTVYSGVMKDGQSIDIVFRPSDNNEVIFYYGSEKQTLETPTSELWVADSTSIPEQLTLGRILIVNNINKVRLN